MNFSNLAKIDLDELTFDFILFAYVHFFLGKILSGRMNIIDLINFDTAYAGMILFHFFVIAYMVTLVKRYNEMDISFFPGFFSLIFFIIALITLIEGQTVLQHVYQKKQGNYGILMLLELAAIVIAITAGIFFPKLKEIIENKISDEIVRESLFQSLPILFTGIAAILLCFNDQFILWEFVVHMKMPTSWGVYLFIGLSGLSVIRTIVLFTPPIRPLNLFAGLSALGYYFYTIVSVLPVKSG